MFPELCIGLNVLSVASGGLILTLLTVWGSTPEDGAKFYIPRVIGLLCLLVHIPAWYATAWKIFRSSDGWALALVGVATVAGYTRLGSNFPTTIGAYDSTHNGSDDMFVSRLSMGVSFHADRYELSLKQAGTQNLWLDAGKVHANRSYAIFGSVTGTRPGITLLGVHIPLNPDLYTIIAMGAVNGKEFTKFRGTLDANGLATASFNVPANLPLPSGFRFYHAYVVYDASGKIYMASNAVPLTLRK